MQKFEGKSLAAGAVIGKIRFYREAEYEIDEGDYDDSDAEIERFEAALIGVAALAMAFITALDANAVLKKRGVIVGGEISPVPEDSAMTKTAVSGGSRVLIKEEVQNWYYIVYNESGGWIRKENLAVIK